MTVTQKNSKKRGADNPTPKTGEKTKKQKIIDEKWEQKFQELLKYKEEVCEILLC
jgi:hypothetical protein